MPSGANKILKAKEKIGNKYGRLTVTEWLGSNEYRQTIYKFLCDCGKECVKTWTTVRQSKDANCGCYTSEQIKSRMRKHGDSSRNEGRTHFYQVWSAMKARCKNKNNKDFAAYGGRGITVCDYWEKYENFKADMADSYQEGLSIDRIDFNKGYFKENCRWTTQEEQCRNRRDNTLSVEKVLTARKLTAEGKDYIEIADALNVPKQTMHHALAGRTWKNVV